MGIIQRNESRTANVTEKWFNTFVISELISSHELLLAELFLRGSIGTTDASFNSGLLFSFSFSSLDLQRIVWCLYEFLNFLFSFLNHLINFVFDICINLGLFLRGLRYSLERVNRGIFLSRSLGTLRSRSRGWSNLWIFLSSSRYIGLFGGGLFLIVFNFSSRRSVISKGNYLNIVKSDFLFECLKSNWTLFHRYVSDEFKDHS